MLFSHFFIRYWSALILLLNLCPILKMYIFFIEILTFFCATVLMPIENSYGSCLSWFFSFHINLFDLWWNCSDFLYSVKLRRFFNESSSQKTFSTLRNIPYTWETRDICSRFWRSELFAIFYCPWVVYSKWLSPLFLWFLHTHF